MIISESVNCQQELIDRATAQLCQCAVAQLQCSPSLIVVPRESDQPMDRRHCDFVTVTAVRRPLPATGCTLYTAAICSMMFHSPVHHCCKHKGMPPGLLLVARLA